jgi:hypothetical protein
VQWETGWPKCEYEESVVAVAPRHPQRHSVLQRGDTTARTGNYLFFYKTEEVQGKRVERRTIVQGKARGRTGAIQGRSQRLGIQRREDF